MTALVLMVLVMFPDIISLAETARTQPANDTPSCNTGAGTSCSFTIASRHEYSTPTFMTVTETSPGSGDHTSNTTIAADRVTLTVTGLTTSTSYNWSVDYTERAALVSAGANEVLSRLPLFITLGLLAVAVAGAIAAYAQFGGGRRRRF